jgi:hypothetical protein
MVGVEADGMASTSRSSRHDESAYCTDCDSETHHEVGLEIRAESDDPQNARFSREPYRVRTCVHCGAERAKRMNDA